MAVPKKKRSLLKKRLRFNSIKKNKIKFYHYKCCFFCGLFIRNHKYCTSCFIK